MVISMTTNQNNYHANQIKAKEVKELQRANAAKEAENYRSNVAKEEETKRSNIAKEQETHRSNVEKELVNRALADETIATSAQARKWAKRDRIFDAIKGAIGSVANGLTPGGVLNSVNRSYGLPTSQDINPQLGRLASAYAKISGA